MKIIQYQLILTLLVKHEKMAAELKLWVVKWTVEQMISLKMVISQLDGWKLSVFLNLNLLTYKIVFVCTRYI
jgi:hypothetical protein